MTIHEPTTFVTDLILGALTAFFAVKLLRGVDSGSRRFWGGAFVSSAAAAAIGGFSHGIGPELSPTAARILWKLTVLLVGPTSFFLVSGAALSAFPMRIARVWIAVAAMKASAYAVWMLGHDAFKYVIFDYGTAMIAVVALQAWRLVRTREAPGARLILGGIALSFMAAGGQYSGLTLHANFNHNDLYHVIQMAATAVLYGGGRELRDQT